MSNRLTPEVIAEMVREAAMEWEDSTRTWRLREAVKRLAAELAAVIEIKDQAIGEAAHWLLEFKRIQQERDELRVEVERLKHEAAHGKQPRAYG